MAEALRRAKAAVPEWPGRMRIRRSLKAAKGLYPGGPGRLREEIGRILSKRRDLRHTRRAKIERRRRYHSEKS